VQNFCTLAGRLGLRVRNLRTLLQTSSRTASGGPKVRIRVGPGRRCNVPEAQRAQANRGFESPSLQQGIVVSPDKPTPTTVQAEFRRKGFLKRTVWQGPTRAGDAFRRLLTERRHKVTLS
jgi:hypothetical protein